jgi:hypothetical protein
MFRAPALCKTYIYAYLDTHYPLSIMNKAYSCAYCRRELTPITTTTNTNGNLGRQYVLCTAWPQGDFGPGTMSHQRYFRWVDRTPSPLSTTTAQPPSTPLPSPPLTAPAFLPPIALQPATYCGFAGCKWKRAPARDCTRNMSNTLPTQRWLPTQRPYQQSELTGCPSPLCSPLCSCFLAISPH